MPESEESWDTYENLPDYRWHHPEDVLITRDADGDIIAYGVHPGVAPEPESHGPVSVLDDLPLARPRHTAVRGPGSRCLACEWVELRNKIEAASDG